MNDILQDKNTIEELTGIPALGPCTCGGAAVLLERVARRPDTDIRNIF